MLKPFLIIFLSIASSQVCARMYQWNDPNTGTTQFSGKPPVWYRSVDGGPRVFVFDNGRVIDDTSISVSDAERERLRQQAFIKAEQDREAAREKLIQAKRIQAKMEQKRLLERENEAEEMIDEDETPEEEIVQERKCALSEYEKRFPNDKKEEQ